MEENNKRNKTYVPDVERGVYDIIDKDLSTFKTEMGLTEEVIREISEAKKEPQWMLDFRLRALKIYNSIPTPTWGPDLSDLKIEDIVMYIRPGSDMEHRWEDVPEDIKATFDRLGIPQAERESLAGVGAQFDSEVVYHNVQKELEEQGVIYTDFESAVINHEEIVKKHFMKLIPTGDHKFAALHAAVWSGGSFVYVPEGVEVKIPIQSYFRLNAKGGGQFEHTLIILEKNSKLHFIEGCSAPKYDVASIHAGAVELYVGDGATLKYSTIENWSKNMYNLNTKRATLGKNSRIEWVSGSFGSRVSMLYPMTILKGQGSHCEFIGVTFANEGQHLDTGSKVIHAASHTTSNINTKSISKGGGYSMYRGLIKTLPGAENCKSTTACESLMLDDISYSDTIPTIQLANDKIDIGHEAKIGTISDDAIFYLMSRGIGEIEAKEMVVKGFVEPITKELPLEYAVELNNLVTLEFEGSIG